MYGHKLPPIREFPQPTNDAPDTTRKDEIDADDMGLDLASRNTILANYRPSQFATDTTVKESF